MQHPDDGMIHSWLDGALSAEDSAAVESHVAGCQQCATVVAEARGFIAASSRILTALDDVPRGVIPVAPARKRDLRVVWRVAAAMLVVAGGSFIALRDGGQDATVGLSPTESAASIDASASDSTANTTMAEVAKIEDKPRMAKTAPVNEQDFARKPAARRAVGSTVVGGSGQAVATDMATPPAGNLSKVSEFGARAEAAPLKVVSIERVIGGSRTTYQIASAQTVTLTETMPLSLSGVVTTAVSEQPRTRAPSPMRAQAAATPPSAPPVAESRLGHDTAVKSTQAAVATGRTMQALAATQGVAQINTISWTEVITGARLMLSGTLPVERLQEIKLSIEKERAAARAKAP